MSRCACAAEAYGVFPSHVNSRCTCTCFPYRGGGSLCRTIAGSCKHIIGIHWFYLGFNSARFLNEGLVDFAHPEPACSESHLNKGFVDFAHPEPACSESQSLHLGTMQQLQLLTAKPSNNFKHTSRFFTC